MKKTDRIQAIRLVAAAIDARKKQGTKDYDKAKAFSDELVKIWKQQLWSKKKCPHCGRWSLTGLDYRRKAQE